MELRNAKVISREDIMSDDASEPEYYDQAEQSAASAPAPVPAGAHGRVGGASTSATTETVLAGFMESFVRMQAETNRTLVETLRAFNGSGKPPTSTPTPDSRPPSVYPSAVTGNFAKCTARFDGKSRDAEVLEAFIDAVQVYKECAGVSDEHALRGLPILLEGDAAVWWRGARANVHAWPDAVARLRAMYGMQLPPYKVLREIVDTNQKDSERAEVFMCKVRSLFTKLPYAVPMRIQLDIIYGLLHRRVRKRLPRDDVDNIDLMLEKVRAIEDSIVELNLRTYAANPIVSTSKSTSQNLSRSQDAPRDRAREPESSERERSVTTSSNGTSVAKLTPNSNENLKRDKRVRCSFCKFYGHVLTDCRNFQNKNNKPQPTSALSSSGPNNLRCYGCGQPGVVKSKCENCSGKQLPATRCDFNMVNGENDLREAHAATPSHAMVSVTIANRVGAAILDTGATCCVAGSLLYSILTSVGVQFHEAERTIGLAIGSRQTKTVLTATVPVILEGRQIDTEFIVFPGESTRTLLGRDFITKAGVTLDLSQESWFFADNPEQIFPLVQSFSLNSTELMQADISDVALRDAEGTNLPPEHRNALNAFLRSRANQFAADGPPTDFACHKIKVRENQEPLASPPYRLSPSKKEALEKELQKLLSADVIEECESPWASNVVLVKKKDGSYRLCVDYRKLNAVTEPDRYPLPRIEDVLHAAKTSKYMSTLDLRSGYFQVSVDPDHRDFTSFTTPLGTFRFKRMPMGLRNSGATFQRLIDRFKSNLPGITLLAYLDDLLVLSEDSFERHLADLETVFDRLAMFNLRVNREKSHFARDAVKFLGHVIVPGGIHMDPEKTSAITGMPPPQNVRQLKCFLQTSSWFRRFIPGYAEVSRPLTSLLKKGNTWEWGPEQQNAFETIKSLLTSAPILRQADGTKPFVLRTDSSGYALGAALLQGEGTDERPVEYASRLLTAAEKNYNTTEREALAVVWAVSKFRGYIDGADVTVKSDHQPLRWLMSLKSPSGRLARWALSLQEYNLKIEYTPGKANVIADTLSRPVCATEDIEGTECDLRLAVVDIPFICPGPPPKGVVGFQRLDDLANLRVLHLAVSDVPRAARG
ncbi:uncharacterized protein LOC126911298 [Spodoptera frugiperda]|uniref:RNA-directed DNA polymerase n=1 Tax=Spodoptera frugiperda TaxID=7108 RepID=A0A9R0EXD9_SPOFR|nr:uncharacterized protein LOC126911298 [Spodoptera frugiperda]